MKKITLVLILLVGVSSLFAQQDDANITTYKKRVLETTEIDFLNSIYIQNGENAAVSGGIGTEKLTDATAAVVVSIPLNDDDVLSIDAGVSAYTSASSSNINPFDGKNVPDPFVASSGASASDVWSNFTGTYSHSSDDRNQIWHAKLSISAEFDYFSAGIGGGYAHLFNEKNTELSLNANVYIDTWNPIYPAELRPFASGGNGINNTLFKHNTIIGNTNYNPILNDFTSKGRNSYSVGLGFAQILSKRLQSSLAADFVWQSGLLSTPFQRVYFSDIADSFIGNFQLADANEKLPNTRFKIALGGRLNYFVNEYIVVRTFYRYYFDNWKINAHTASIEVPIKISEKFTLYPSFRYYNQTAAKYFKPYNELLSTAEFYTSDYDLSAYSANQYGLGISYTDIFAKAHIWKFGLKSIDLKFYHYDRNTGFYSNIITTGLKFVME
ncbi:MAG: DUF3570 domain-containing protein [Chitinophagales bacterium]|nr:DUF3570 domain-containing protein [Chitinophagales bacterium]